MNKLVITKRNKSLFVYYPSKDGIYLDKLGEKYDWLCTIKRKSLDWNDSQVPELKDVLFISDIWNNFDELLKIAQKDFKLIEGF
jgi:hypothetical protein